MDNESLMCYVCAIDASREGKFVKYDSENGDKCEKHPDYNLWKVHISNKMDGIIKQLLSTYEYSKFKSSSRNFSNNQDIFSNQVGDV
jgi:hypothetical protein